MRDRMINISLLVDLHQPAPAAHSASPKGDFLALTGGKTLFTLGTNSPRSLASPQEVDGSRQIRATRQMEAVRQKQTSERNTRAHAAIRERGPPTPLKNSTETMERDDTD